MRTLLEHFKTRLRDKDNVLFEDLEYEDFLWNTRQTHTRHTVYARRDGTSNIFMYGRCGQTCGGTHLWKVEVQSPSVGEEYVIDEGRMTVHNTTGGETADSIALTGASVNLNIAAFNALMAASNNPSKAVIYMSSNGLTVDTRDAPDALRIAAQHELGVS